MRPILGKEEPISAPNNHKEFIECLPPPPAGEGFPFSTPVRTEAKENKYALGKSASDGRYSFVGVRSLFGEALCTKLVILQPPQGQEKWCGVVCYLSFRTRRTMPFLQATAPATENFFHRG
jgi:hypothetical protein